jgi:hypothetical protein
MTDRWLVRLRSRARFWKTVLMSVFSCVSMTVDARELDEIDLAESLVGLSGDSAAAATVSVFLDQRTSAHPRVGCVVLNLAMSE